MRGSAVGVHSTGLEQRMRLHVLQTKAAPQVDGGVTCQQTEVSVLAHGSQASHTGIQVPDHANTYSYYVSNREYFVLDAAFYGQPVKLL